MFNLNKSVVRLSVVAAVFLATASFCDAGERGGWTSSEDSGSHQSNTANQEDGTKVSAKLKQDLMHFMIPINIKTFLVSNTVIFGY